MKGRYNSKKIVFRCDASPEIGLSHLIRCLTVAKKLKKNNQIIFASIKNSTNSYIKNSYFKIFFKKQNEREKNFLSRIKTILKPDILVIDKKYPYSSICLKDLKQAKIKIVIIDNICKGMSIADEIIFPVAHLDKNLLKKYLFSKQIKNVKSGSEYIILRDEILAFKNQIKRNYPSANIVVTTGGTDPKGVLLKLILWLKEMNLRTDILILVGKSFKFQKKLEKIKKSLPRNFHILSYSPKELTKGDIAICTFGVSVYEMIYLKIPTISIAHNKENAYGAKILEKRYGVIKDMGNIKDVAFQEIRKAVMKLLEDKNYYKKMVDKCNNLIDGKGAERTAELILGQ